MLRWISVISSLWWSNFGMYIVAFFIDLKALNFSLVVCIRKSTSFDFASWLCIYYYFRLLWYSWRMKERAKKMDDYREMENLPYASNAHSVYSEKKIEWITEQRKEATKDIKDKEKLFHSILWAIRSINQENQGLCCTLRPLLSSYYYYYYY